MNPSSFSEESLRGEASGGKESPNVANDDITPALRAAIENVLIATGTYRPILPPGATMPTTLAEAVVLWGNTWRAWREENEPAPSGGHA